MATSPAASSSSAPTASAVAAATMAVEATDGPVLSVVSKRLRALRKKYNRITQMEESLAAGKTLNREQEEVLRSKPVVAALIDELERLRPPLASALAEELSSRPAPAPSAASSSDSDSSVQDLLALVYFGSLFDVKQQSDFVSLVYTRELERSSCLTYDYVGDDPEDSLAETDLNAVSALASLAALRPPAAAGVSHRDALQACAHHARLWLCRADEPIHPDSTITYAGVRAKLDRIMASGYFTAQLEMRTPLDLAAAVASFGAGGVQVQESMVVSPQAPEAVEESQAVEGHKNEKEDSQATEIYNDHPVVDSEHVEDEVLVHPTDEVPPAETEQEQETFDADVKDQEQKDQQFIQRRSYQNQRGGGRGGSRRGYPNGRGGRGGRGGGYQNGRGGYQNGRGGAGGYYYESGYYQPRNYNRGRGGRSGGGNSYYNSHGGGAQGHHPGSVELGANA
ncbi:uncharacterized protein LOC100382366 [Zea mays]|uniref:Glycine-rich protein n=1 Tax=Zea mays TaxID=4577 RepID=C0P6Z0_MAIZE|nr:uncharacterized protein LOC100382366 [Zea mays]ACN28756.1 unknown [Zea mays]ONM07820.1 hypothetical protein ZEAMMB73_Zm00001d033549 [Zea mays]ONM07822.1 hypothetical protein ZEAMMB73_Zm00001d033549 [Zea mays]|eukprot:NP_001168582.1 uncharacterized protein LOC100382366 [Zea mays]